MEKDQLFRYFMGVSTTTEDAEMRRWVENSDENRTRFMEERKIFDIASLIDIDDETATAAPAPATTRRHKLWRAVRRAAAVAAIAVAAVWSYETFIAPSSVTEKNTVAMQALEIPAGQRLKVQLSDGSSVWLNSNTRMEFPGVFSADSRTVTIDGEAYFEVSKDNSRPFIVNSPNGRVKVTGTKFNVDDYSTDAGYCVSLIEGSVEVSTGGTTHHMKAGTRLNMTDGQCTSSTIADEDIEWINGIVSFRQKQLPEILQRFEKYYGMKVDYRLSKDIPDTRFSGRFYIDEGIEQALQTLQCDVNFNYTIDKDARKVIIR